MDYQGGATSGAARGVDMLRWRQLMALDVADASERTHRRVVVSRVSAAWGPMTGSPRAAAREAERFVAEVEGCLPSRGGP